MIVGVDLYSYHTDPSKGYENVTPGIYASFEPSPGGDLRCAPTFGAYKNSERNLSFHAGCSFTMGRFARLYVGGVSGYKAGTQPLVMPSVLLPVPGTDGATFLSVSFVPRVNKMGSGVVHFSVERKF